MFLLGQQEAKRPICDGSAQGLLLEAQFRGEGGKRKCILVVGKLNRILGHLTSLLLILGFTLIINCWANIGDVKTLKKKRGQDPLRCKYQVINGP